MPAALTLAADASGDGPVAASAVNLRNRVLEGQDFGGAPPDGDSGLPPWLWRALAVGQASGDLVTVLERVGVRFEAAAQRSAERLGKVLEPTMILIVGLFVGLVAYGALLPIVRLNRLW
jgi:type II secretory pathway component PulF